MNTQNNSVMGAKTSAAPVGGGLPALARPGVTVGGVGLPAPGRARVTMGGAELPVTSKPTQRQSERLKKQNESKGGQLSESLPVELNAHQLAEKRKIEAAMNRRKAMDYGKNLRSKGSLSSPSHKTVELEVYGTVMTPPAAAPEEEPPGVRIQPNPITAISRALSARAANTFTSPPPQIGIGIKSATPLAEVRGMSSDSQSFDCETGYDSDSLKEYLHRPSPTPMDHPRSLMGLPLRTMVEMGLDHPQRVDEPTQAGVLAENARLRAEKQALARELADQSKMLLESVEASERASSTYQRRTSDFDSMLESRAHEEELTHLLVDKLKADKKMLSEQDVRNQARIDGLSSIMAKMSTSLSSQRCSGSLGQSLMESEDMYTKRLCWDALITERSQALRMQKRLDQQACEFCKKTIHVKTLPSQWTQFTEWIGYVKRMSTIYKLEAKALKCIVRSHFSHWKQEVEITDFIDRYSFKHLLGLLRNWRSVASEKMAQEVKISSLVDKFDGRLLAGSLRVLRTSAAEQKADMLAAAAAASALQHPPVDHMDMSSAAPLLDSRTGLRLTSPELHSQTSLIIGMRALGIDDPEEVAAWLATADATSPASADTPTDARTDSNVTITAEIAKSIVYEAEMLMNGNSFMFCEIFENCYFRHPEDNFPIHVSIGYYMTLLCNTDTIFENPRPLGSKLHFHPLEIAFVKKYMDQVGDGWMYTNLFGGAIGALILARKSLSIPLWIVGHTGTSPLDTSVPLMDQRHVSFADTPAPHTPVRAQTPPTSPVGTLTPPTPPARTSTNQTPTAAASGGLRDKYGRLFEFH